MSAELIDLLPRRIEELAEDIAKDCPDLSEGACRRIATREVARSLPRPEIAPDDPIYGLFDAYKTAERTYRDAMRSLARRHGRQMSSMAGILRSVRHCAKNPRRFLTPAELKAKYEAMSPEEKASFSREFERIMGETQPA